MAMPFLDRKNRKYCQYSVLESPFEVNCRFGPVVKTPTGPLLKLKCIAHGHWTLGIGQWTVDRQISCRLHLEKRQRVQESRENPRWHRNGISSDSNVPPFVFSCTEYSVQLPIQDSVLTEVFLLPNFQTSKEHRTKTSPPPPACFSPNEPVDRAGLTDWN